MNRQDRELRIRWAQETQQQKAEEIGQHMADRLEKTEQALLKELSANQALIRDIPLTHHELVFAGIILEGDLQMPWDGTVNQGSTSTGNQSRNLMLQAQQAEFTQKNLSRAKTLYNRALASTNAPSQQNYVRLQLGRILFASRDEDGALQLYTEVLAQPHDLTDEYGIPFCLYAADRLSVISKESELVIDRLEGLFNKDSWLPPSALYLIRDVSDQLKDKAHISSQLVRIQGLDQAVEDGLKTCERILSLKPFVKGWISLSYDGPKVLRAVIEEDGLDETFPGSCWMTSSFEEGTFRLGESFRELRLQFEERGVSAWAKSSLPLPIFYWLILILVIGFTGFGMSLLWRDFRRELTLADMRSQFAASVSHELKTPLTAIRMFAEALTMGVQKNPEAQQEYLHTIISESERLSRLLNNVLDFSKIEQGTRTYSFESLSLENVIQAAAKAMAFPMQQKGFNLQVETENDIPEVRADKDALEQAVLNLLHNAMKYSGDSREIQLKLFQKDYKVQIDVKDFGIGISDEDKTKIFGRFFRGPGSENLRIPGTGLGLTIVSHIAEDSQPRKGSTFSITIPLEQR